MLDTRIAVGHAEQIARERFGALRIPQRNEYLANADERTGLARPVAECATEFEALLERLERAGGVPSVVEEEPAESVKRGGELIRSPRSRQSR